MRAASIPLQARTECLCQKADAFPTQRRTKWKHFLSSRSERASTLMATVRAGGRPRAWAHADPAGLPSLHGRCRYRLLCKGCLKSPAFPAPAHARNPGSRDAAAVDPDTWYTPRDGVPHQSAARRATKSAGGLRWSKAIAASSTRNAQTWRHFSPENTKCPHSLSITG